MKYENLNYENVILLYQKKKLGIVMFVIFVGLYQQGYCRGGYNGGIMAVI